MHHKAKNLLGLNLALVPEAKRPMTNNILSQIITCLLDAKNWNKVSYLLYRSHLYFILKENYHYYCVMTWNNGGNYGTEWFQDFFKLDLRHKVKY